MRKPNIHLLLYSIGFILFTIIGTISHEYGHVAIANCLGYKTTLHYGSMNWERDFPEYSNELFIKYPSIDSLPALVRKQYEAKKSKDVKDTLAITLGGPAQTILVGLIGLLILGIRRGKHRMGMFKAIDWIAVYFSLFWSREIFNLIIGVFSWLLNSSDSLFTGDEFTIANLLGLPNGFVSIPLGVLGLVICLNVVLKIIPKENRNRFILGGLIGSLIGYVIWFVLIGPIILP